MRRLLIVDDSADLLYALQSMVSFYNFEVRTAKDRKTFQREFDSFKPDVALIDVALDGDNGKEISKVLRDDQANKNVTIILFSSSSQLLEKFKDFGADGIIEKPFGIAELVNKIKSVELDRKRIAAKNKKEA